MKKTWHNLEGTFWERQYQESGEKCACGCGRYITNRTAKRKAKGLTLGYIKGHFWKGKEIPEEHRKKMRVPRPSISGSNHWFYGNSDYFAGENNPNWQGGKKEKYYKGKNQPDINTKQDLDFRREIKQRDGQCVMCGNISHLTVHHIESWVDREDLRFEPKNCITLCKSCHCRADNAHHKDRIKPMLIAYINKLYG